MMINPKNYTRNFRYRSDVSSKDRNLFWIMIMIGIALAAVVIFVL